MDLLGSLFGLAVCASLTVEEVGQQGLSHVRSVVYVVGTVVTAAMVVAYVVRLSRSER